MSSYILQVMEYLNTNMKKKDVEITHAYIGYSDSGDKESCSEKLYPDIPERVLVYFTSMHSMPVLPELVLKSNDLISLRNKCYARRMTRQQVIDVVETLDDQADRQEILQKMTEIREDATFILIVEDYDKIEAKLSKKCLDKQLVVKNCIQFRGAPVPMCSKQFAVHESDVELGYVRGVFIRGNKPFFAKLWRSEQSGLKYATIVFEFHHLEECKYQAHEIDDEVASVLKKSGLDVIGLIYDAETLSKTIRFLSRHGIFQFATNQHVLHYSCYQCEDREGNMLFAYTTEVTEKYEDEPMKTQCNLDFLTHDFDEIRAIDLLNEKIIKHASREKFEEQFQIVKGAIDQWDIYSLIRAGVNDDEYDIESDKIAAIITENSTVDEISEAISHVFILMFSDKHIIPKRCVWPAKLIREGFDMKYLGVADNSVGQKLSDDSVRRFFINEDWVYYTCRNDGATVYRVRTNGSDRQRVINDRSAGVCVVDDWLYFNNLDDEWKIYRIRTDGTERKKISDYDIDFFLLTDGWIYYCNRGHYRLRTNGTDRQKICDGLNCSFKVDGEWLYYIEDQSDNRCKLVKIRTDGTEKIPLNVFTLMPIYIYDNWVYFNNDNDKGKLYRVCIDGVEIQKIADFRAVHLTFMRGWLYCQREKRGYSSRFMKIYKMRPDGSEDQLLSNLECGDYMIDSAGEWIYFSNKNDGFTLYKMRTDGTEAIKLNNNISSHMQVVGEWIYYIRNSACYPQIYRMSLDSSEQKMIAQF